MEVYLEIIFAILATIGGASGIKNLLKWLKNRAAKIKVISSNAEYYVHQDDLIIHTKIQVHNEKEEPIYITDILGLLKTDSSKTQDKKGKVYSKRPTTPVFSPTKIAGKSTLELNFETNFLALDIKPLNRIGLVNILGFLENEIPVLITKESDFDEKWDQLPLEMKLVLHINGKEIVPTTVGVFSRETTDITYGTLNSVDIVRLEREYEKDRGRIAKI